MLQSPKYLKFEDSTCGLFDFFSRADVKTIMSRGNLSNEVPQNQKVYISTWTSIPKSLSNTQQYFQSIVTFHSVPKAADQNPKYETTHSRQRQYVYHPQTRHHLLNHPNPNSRSALHLPQTPQCSNRRHMQLPHPIRESRPRSFLQPRRRDSLQHRPRRCRNMPRRILGQFERPVRPDRSMGL
jgi:hypothetical protein